MSELYRLPCKLDTSEVRAAIAALGIVQRTYLANGVLHHSFTDPGTHRRVHIVESLTSCMPSEVVGDVSLWLWVREVARTAHAAPILQHQHPPVPTAA